MSAKLLQLVNSPLFGIRGAVTSPAQAVSLIGLDNIRTLVLSVHIFSQVEPALATALSWLWDHSLQTAALARAIANAQGADLKTADAAFTAGMLHDIGKLLLASALPCIRTQPARSRRSGILSVFTTMCALNTCCSTESRSW